MGSQPGKGERSGVKVVMKVDTTGGARKRGQQEREGGTKMTSGPGRSDGWMGVSECVVRGLAGAGQAHQWGWRQEGMDS